MYSKLNYDKYLENVKTIKKVIQKKHEYFWLKNFKNNLETKF